MNNWRMVERVAVVVAVAVFLAPNVLAAPPVVTVLFPNNGENITTRYLDINWSATDPENDTISLSIYYDTDTSSANGRTLITQSEANDGTFRWDLLGLPRDQFFISIDAIAGFDITTDYSDKKFTKQGYNDSITGNNASVLVQKNLPPIVSVKNLTGPLRGQVLWQFNVSDPEGLPLYATVYATPLTGALSVELATDLYLSSICTDSDSNTSTTNQCSIILNTSALDGFYLLEVEVTDTLITVLGSSQSVRIDNLPEVGVSSPNGGEQISSFFNITWTASDISGFSQIVDLYVDVDNTTTNGRTLLSANESNDGVYSWVVGDLFVGQTYFISIDTISTGADSTGNIVSIKRTDYSNASWLKIASNLTYTGNTVNVSVGKNNKPIPTVLSPNGGETINTSLYLVNFTATDPDLDLLSASLYLSTSAGAKQTLIVTGLDLNSSICGTTCLYLWNVSALGPLNGNFFLDLVVTDSVNTATDSSNGSFLLDSKPTIANVSATNITSSSAVIVWVSNEPTNSTIRYGLTTAYGSVATNPTLLTSHAITLTNLTGNRLYHFQVESCDGTNNCVVSSDQNMTILDNPQSITVLAPNGGENLSVGIVQINWTAFDKDADNLTISLYYDVDAVAANGRTLIASGEQNDGSYLWDLSGVPKGSFFLAIDAVSVLVGGGNLSVTDYSNGSFTITILNLTYTGNTVNVSVVKNNKPIPTLLSPNGGEFIDTSTFLVNFTATDPDLDLLIASLYLSTSAGAKQTLIVTGLDLNSSICGTTCLYLWNVSALGPMNGNFFLDLVVTDSVNSVTDSSNGSFTLDADPGITNVTATNATPSSALVSWLTNEPTNSTVRYGLTTSYGAIVRNASLILSHALVITNLTGNRLYHYQVESCDATGNCMNTTDYNVTSLDNPHTITVLSPNGGENVTQNLINLTWTTIDLDGDTLSIDLYYDTDGISANGRALIAKNETNDGVYLWDITGLPSGSYFFSADASVNVRASNTTYTVTDYSNGPFTKPVLNLTYTGNTVTVTVTRNTGPSVALIAPKPFDRLLTQADVNFTASDPDADALLATLSYSGSIYTVPLTVTNDVGKDVVDYPVHIVIDTSSLIQSGKMRPDGVDMKVIVNLSEVPLYIENFDTAHTDVWFPITMSKGQVRSDVVLSYGPSTSISLPRQEPPWQNLSAGTNVAYNQTIIASSEDPSFKAKNVIDGDRGTKWVGTGVTDFLKITLNVSTKPYMVNYTLTGAGIAKTITSISIDDANYTVVGNTTYASGQIRASHAFRPQSVRYLLVDARTHYTQNELFEAELLLPHELPVSVGSEQSGQGAIIVSNLDLSLPTVCNDPDGNTSTSNNCTYRWDVSKLDGVFCITAEVKDPLDFKSSSTVCNVTIDNLNDFPVLLQPIQNMSISKGKNASLNMSFYFTDPNGDPLNYTSTAAQNITVLIDNVTDIVTIIPDATFVGVRNLSIVAIDTQGAMTSSNIFRVTVGNPPVFNGTIANQTWNKNTNQSLTIGTFFSDPDGLPLTYRAIQSSVMKIDIDNATGIATLSPAQGFSGITNTSFTAIDAEGLTVDSNLVRLNVTNINNPPSLQNFSNITVNETQLITITAIASDPDKDNLTYFINDTHYTKSGNVFTWQTGFGDAGIYHVRVNVTDGFAWDNESLVVTVKSVNQGPRISGIPNQTVQEDSTPLISIELFNYTFDPDTPLSNLTYAIENQSNVGLINCFLNSSHTVTCSPPTSNGYGENNITVSAFDGSSKGYGTFGVTVLPVNDPPSLGPIPNGTVNEDTTPPNNWIDLFPVATDEDTDVQLSFSIIFQSNSSLISCSIGADQFVNCNTPAANQSGVSMVTVQVMDTGGLVAKANTTITVTEVNDLPAVSALFPVDNTNTSLVTQNFTARVFDLEEDNFTCTLYLAGVGSDTKGVGENVNFTLTGALVEGSLSWNIGCFDGKGTGFSTTRTLHVYTDLAVKNSEIFFTPSNPLEGSSVMITATVRNLGAVNTTSVTVGFYQDNFSTQIGTTSITLPTGSGINTSLNWTAVRGNHTILVIADPLFQKRDSNRSNNNASASITTGTDTFPPTFSLVNVTDVKENSKNATFRVDVFDVGVGVDKNAVTLLFNTTNTSSSKLMSFVTGNTFQLVLTPLDVNFDLYQNTSLTFAVRALDLNANLNTSPSQKEFIEIENDVPTVSVIQPNGSSEWRGTQTIQIVTGNDNEGPVNSTLYYWDPFDFAPSYEENASEYFRQGVWVQIANIGSGTSYNWSTLGINGYNMINVTTTDKTYGVSNLSAVFIIDNTPVSISLDNYLYNTTYLTNAKGEIFGTVDAQFGNIATFTVNDSRFTLVKSPIGQMVAPFLFQATTNLTSRISLNITASDVAGNRESLVALFEVDNTSPVIQGVGFENAFTNDQIVIKVNASDNTVIRSVQALTPNGSITLQPSYQATFTGPPIAGVYDVLVTVIDEANNSVQQHVNFTVALGPDLIIQNITLTPLNISTGALTTVSGTVKNIGGKYADNVTVSFLANSQVVGQSVVSLVNQTIASLPWNTTGFAGTVYVEVRIEPSAGVYESLYTNNNASVSTYIDGPDLIVSAMSFAPPAPSYEGQTVTITADIKNLRSVPANNVQISFYTSVVELDHRINFQEIDIPAFSSVATSVDWQTAGFPGNTTLIVEANTLGVPGETDRTNNFLNATYETKPYIPEGIPDTLIFPERPMVSVTGQIRGMASTDIDKNNKTDVIIGTNNGSVILYYNNGAIAVNQNRTKSVNFTLRTIAYTGEATWGLSSADFFRDGYPEIVIGTESGRVIVYNNSFGTFVNNLTVLDVGDWAYGLAVSDFNNDNIFDLVVGNKIGQVNLYLNNMSNFQMKNTSFVFNQTLTTRDQPFGLTTGDFDGEGHVDIMVGDRLGQIERVVYENGKYNGFLFADTGAFAHGLTVADIDYSGHLDLFALGFDGDVRMYFSREGGLVADPLIIGNVQNSFGLTSGDYDQDNDVDIMVGSEDGNVTMLMNSLRIVKTTTPTPTPPRRNVEQETIIQNPWARDMDDFNLTELWFDNLTFVKDAYTFCIRFGPFGCEEYFYGDMYFKDTPRDIQLAGGRVEHHVYYLDEPSDVCEQICIDGGFGCSFPANRCDLRFTYTGKMQRDSKTFNVTGLLKMFNLSVLHLRESFKFRYTLFTESVTNATMITVFNYTLLGDFNTPYTSYLLSDDVTNLNDVTANTKNINTDPRHKNDRDFIDNLVIAPDITPTNIGFSGFSFPPVPGEVVSVTVDLKNLQPIAIQNMKIALFVDGKVVQFGSNNFTYFNIGSLGATSISMNIVMPTANQPVLVEAVVNPLLDDIETNYTNNNISDFVVAVPPTDLRLDFVKTSNGSVQKTVFTEGETIVVFANITNIGNNHSYYEDIFNYGLPFSGCIGSKPSNALLNCSLQSPYYDANLCDGDEFCGNGCVRRENITPGSTISQSLSYVLGDKKGISQGRFNTSILITNVGSIDQDMSNNAGPTEYVVLPSQIDLRYDYNVGFNCVEFSSGVSLTNGVEKNISLSWAEFNDGGFDITQPYDSIVYLDNNDSFILGRVVDQTIGNHTSASRGLMVNWTNLPPGDHVVNSYIDYGKNSNESTARAVSSQGMIYAARASGVNGNYISIKISNRDIFRTTLSGFHANASTVLRVVSTTGFQANDSVNIIGEGIHVVTAVNATQGTLTIATPTQIALGDGTPINEYFPTIFQINVTQTLDVVQQTAFDYITRTTSQSYAYDLLSDNKTDIVNLSTVLSVLANGGYTLSGQFLPSNLTKTETSSLNLSAAPIAETRTLRIGGSLTGERGESGHESRTVFRWPEVIMSGISHSPQFPAARDAVAVTGSVSNAGNLPTGPFTVGFFVNGVLNQTVTVSLGPGGSQSLTFFYVIPRGDLLKYNVQISADLIDVVHYEDESNNNASDTIPVSAPFEVNVLGKEYGFNHLESLINVNGSLQNTTWNLESFPMEYDASPSFVDYNNDGDVDLFIGSLDGKFTILENTGNAGSPLWTVTDLSTTDWKTSELSSVIYKGISYPAVSLATLDVGSRSTVTLGDMDNDTIRDVITGDTHGHLRGFKGVYVGQNIFNSSTGQFEFVVKKTYIELGFNLTQIPETFRVSPVLFDMEGDGDQDLMIGSVGGLKLYENIGNINYSVWQEVPITLPAGETVALGDIDGDAVPDLLVGSASTLIAYRSLGNGSFTVLQSITMPDRTSFHPALSDLNGDGRVDAVVGATNPIPLPLQRGYFEPVNIQLVNYAKNQIDVQRISLDVINDSTGALVTTLFADNPTNALVVRQQGDKCPVQDMILKGIRMSSQGVVEKEYDIDLPQDLPQGASFRIRATKQENVNPAFFYELYNNDLCGPNTILTGSRTSPVFIDRPQLGGPTFDLFVDPDATYEYRGSYKVYYNGTMSPQVSCLENWCPMYYLVPNDINIIVGSGEIRRLVHRYQTGFEIVTPTKPPLELTVDNKFGMQLKPGYIEDVKVSVINNNKRSYTIDRIAMELLNQGPVTGNITIGNDNGTITVPVFGESRLISLYTDTNGFPLTPKQKTSRTYKVYIPDGVPLESMFLVKAIEKHGFTDAEYIRSNIPELWPASSSGDFGGKRFSDNLDPASLYDNKNPTMLTDPVTWGHQSFDFGVGCFACGDDGFNVCGEEESFMRKQMWVSSYLQKSEQKEALTQICNDICFEPPSGITAWVNGNLKSSLLTECSDINYGWTPNFGFLTPGQNNEIDLYSFGPHRIFENTFYEVRGVDYIQNVTILPPIPAFQMNVTGAGENGLLRRQYEEQVNVTVTNNDDDPVTVDVITLKLLSPQNKEIQLLTDTTPRTIPPLSKINVTYVVVIPSDVPLNSELNVQVERVFGFADLIWNRDHEITLAELLNESIDDYHWGDTVSSGEASNYRKHVFLPTDMTRAEIVLGDASFTTNVYVNGEFQGSGYPGWSPLSLTSTLRQGKENTIAVTGAISGTQSRVYSGQTRTLGRVIDAESDVFFTVFGMREQTVVPGREPFFVFPGEQVTARILVENKYNKQLDFQMTLSVVDFTKLQETILNQQTLTIAPYETKYLEVTLNIPTTVSNQTRLQLGSVWNERLLDKNWLRGSNFNDAQASNKFLDDSQWGVTAVGPANEQAIYFRKHIWVDSTVEEIRIQNTGVSQMWVNGLPVSGTQLKNEFTKSESNMITLKATNYNVDSEIYLDHFVPVRSTDLEIANVSYSNLTLYTQGSLSCSTSVCDCKNTSLGTCVYATPQGSLVKANFTLRNAGELFADGFNLTVTARRLSDNTTTVFHREDLTMHPFSQDLWTVSWPTQLLAGAYEFAITADADDDIIETSEFNNIAPLRVYVNAPPSVAFVDTEEVQGLNESVHIVLQVIDRDGNEKTTLILTAPDNTTSTVPLIAAGNRFLANFSTMKSGRYSLNLTAVDDFNKSASLVRVFDVEDSVYLNVKTGQDLYYYTQTVRLTGIRGTNFTKAVPNTRPTLFDAFDGAGEIKGGSEITLLTRASDPEGDLLTLVVCSTSQLTSTGCAALTLCTASARFNPSCTFIAPRDDQKHDWYAAVLDTHGQSSNVIAGNFTSDSTPPLTRFFAIAGDQGGVDTQDDQKTLLTVEGEPGMSCRVGKDAVYRLHQDRSAPLLTQNCTVANGWAVCDLGALTKDDPSKDRITNLTRAYVSCSDALGNEQLNEENVDVSFGIEPVASVTDTYRGQILSPGSSVQILGTTTYCIDSVSRCNPNTPISNGSVTFSESGVFHLRYVDGLYLRDVVVLVNTLPSLGEMLARDLPQHTILLTLPITDVDAQNLSCILSNNVPMAIAQGYATARVSGAPGTLLTVQATCSDGYGNVTSAQVSRTFANSAPSLRNVPDVSVDINRSSVIDIAAFGFDEEKDPLTYALSNVSGSAVTAVLSGTRLNVTARSVGVSTICLTVSDTQVGSTCIHAFAEDQLESKLKNNEFGNTTFRLQMKIQYYDTTGWVDEVVSEVLPRVTPGARAQVDLSRLFSWNSSGASHPNGLYRVLFTGFDAQNQSIRNRDGSVVQDSYNFTLLLFNTAPNITLTNEGVFQQDTITLNLAAVTQDNEQNPFTMNYTILNVSDSSRVSCSITTSTLKCTAGNTTGSVFVDVRVSDGFATDTSTLNLTVYNYQQFRTQAQNLTYTFQSNVFNLSGDPYSGFRQVFVDSSTQPGDYDVIVIVSDGVTNVSGTFTVTVQGNASLQLNPIGDQSVEENQTLSIQLGATGSNASLRFGTNADDVLLTPFTFNETSGLFTWTPTFVDYGVYSVTFNVTDGVQVDEETIRITVTDAQFAVLVIDGDTTQGENLTFHISDPAAAGKEYILALSLFGPDIDLGDGRTVPLTNDGILHLTLFNASLINLTDSQGVLNASGEATAVWTMPRIRKGVQFRAAFVTIDPAEPLVRGVISISNGEIITISDKANRQPKLDPIGDKKLEENNTLTIQLKAHDADRDNLTFTLNASGILTPYTFDNKTGLFTWTPSFIDYGNYSLTFGVTDGAAADNETILVQVTDAHFMTLQAFGNFSSGENVTFLLTDPASAGKEYLILFSLYGPDLDLGDGRTAPLSVDGIYTLTLFNASSINLTNSQGILNSSGQAIATWNIPHIRKGFQMRAAAGSLEMGEPIPRGVISISNGVDMIFK